ncbi:MAG: RNA pseudouridine synthase, partial [Clostridia bacterium]|nr:RNA pseudouridine synthase [Clostridia bacterium]
MNKLIVESSFAGKRIDAFIAENVENMSRNACVNLIEEGNITVNGKNIKKNYKVSEGDVVEITMPELKPYEAIPQKMDLDIRYEDKDVLVINKPKGMVVHPAP